MFNSKKNKETDNNEYKLDLGVSAMYFCEKNTGFVNYVGIPTLKQALKDGRSVVVTDYKGFLLNSYGDEFRKAGYKVVVFNTESAVEGNEDVTCELKKEIGQKKIALFILLTESDYHKNDAMAVTYIADMLQDLFNLGTENAKRGKKYPFLDVPVHFILNDDLRIIKEVWDLIDRVSIGRKYGITFTLRFYSLDALLEAFPERKDRIVYSCDRIAVLGDLNKKDEADFIKRFATFGKHGDLHNVEPSIERDKVDLKTGEQLVFQRDEMPVIVKPNGEVIGIRQDKYYWNR